MSCIYLTGMNMHDMHLQKRVARSGVTQERLALTLGIDPTQFSRYIRGLRRAPEGFEEQVSAMLDRLEAAEQAAEQAAQEARERILANEE